jgi:tetratricopeptide (TPR) repeat protein
MKNFTKHSVVITLLVFSLNTAVLSNPVPEREWRLYDINADGRFDQADIDELIERGWQEFDYDLNDDGIKDGTDAFALYLKLSVLDRNCDAAVDDQDYGPVDPIKLPDVPDEAIVIRLVDNYVSKAMDNLPIDIETQLFSSLPISRALTFEERIYVFQLTGMSALIQKNLDGAMWAFGRAFQTYSSSASSLGSLAFAVAMAGNHVDALKMLVYAKKLFPESGATAASTGWIFARHGQNTEALQYYRDAVSYAPKIAQYHLNLGILLMRLNRKREAYEEFKTANELDPEDFKTALFRHVTKPPDVPPVKKKPDPEEFEEENDEYREQWILSGAAKEELPALWKDLSSCEKARIIPEIMVRKLDKTMEELDHDYVNDIARRINAITKPYLPQFKKLSVDYYNWLTGVPVIQKATAELVTNDRRDLGNKFASMTRDMGFELLSYGPYFMECALAEAKKAEASWVDYEDVLEYCYRDPMRTAAAWMRTESEPQGLTSKADIEVPPLEGFPLLIPGLCFEIPGYCDIAFNGLEWPSLPFDFTIGLNLWIISFEWNTSTGEVEFNVGQILKFGATWNPKTGFGFQLGVGVDVELSTFKLEAAAYAKISSEGIKIEGELEAKIGFEQLGVKMILFQPAGEEP